MTKAKATKSTDSAKITKLTPMLQQYMEIKEQHPGSILFYRMGDFYEMFFEDAVEAAKLLGITLTSRNKKTDPVQIPMCGIPYHAVQGYLAKLIKAGRRVAICEQVEDPAEAKGIVKREVIRVVSPGVVTDDDLLEEGSNNYLCAVCCALDGKKGTKTAPLYGLSFVDISTGEFITGEFSGDEALDQISRLGPAELLVGEADKNCDLFCEDLRALLPELVISTVDPSLAVTTREARELLQEHFGVLSLDGFGCAGMEEGLVAAAMILSYAKDTQKTAIDHIQRLSLIEKEEVLHLDESSRRNLELTRTIVGGSHQGSLLSILDATSTPMGARFLKSSLLAPLQSKEKIQNRLDALSWYFKNGNNRAEMRNLLDGVYDLERLNSRMTLASANARDMIAMRNSLAVLPKIHQGLACCDTKLLMEIHSRFDLLEDLYLLLDSAIADQPPVTLREGGLIKTGYNQELDELIVLLRDGKALILGLEEQERHATGIAKLKIGYNKVFGYFIEIGKAHAAKAPEHYIRKQTLVNAERFITPELKEFETKVLGAQDRRVDLEYRLFLAIREKLAEASSRILATATLIARLDYFLCCAEIAQRYNYRRPEIDHEDGIEIVEGRHPVIERMLPPGSFVPNDVKLDQRQDEVLVITGPNMAGKSTVLRQTALIVLMAQMGCYVPAEKAKIGIVDRIFTRVGAMDNLRQGQSTFMVEMSETANILNNATEKSLVILDEIGRGTSTYDGLSIAWAVAETLVKKNGLGVKTLFATHYHELTELAKSHNRVRNYSIAVREWKGSIIFLHKLVKGGTSRSYGIQVAALAGVPEEVVQRARDILQEIELGKFAGTTTAKGRSRSKKEKIHPAQLSLLGVGAAADPVHKLLESIDPDSISPKEALAILYQLKQEAGTV